MNRQSTENVEIYMINQNRDLAAEQTAIYEEDQLKETWGGIRERYSISVSRDYEHDLNQVGPVCAPIPSPAIQTEKSGEKSSSVSLVPLESLRGNASEDLSNTSSLIKLEEAVAISASVYNLSSKKVVGSNGVSF